MFAVFQNHMEEQYGEHYAQKVEDRLLQYLHKLETVLPGDTCIDEVCLMLLHFNLLKHDFSQISQLYFKELSILHT